VYTCDPAENDFVVETTADGEDIVYCPYRLKVEITDNWDNCSGNISTGVTRSVNADTCTSYDQYDGLIKVIYN